MTVGRWLLLLGFVCLLIVVLTHVAEMLNVFRGMGWGLPDSPGHYLDLVSAVLGTMLLIAGIVIVFSERRPRRLLRYDAQTHDLRRGGSECHGASPLDTK